MQASELSKQALVWLLNVAMKARCCIFLFKKLATVEFSSGKSDCEFQLWTEPKGASMAVQALYIYVRTNELNVLQCTDWKQRANRSSVRALGRLDSV